jgi:hypothetical protein
MLTVVMLSVIVLTVFALNVNVQTVLMLSAEVLSHSHPNVFQKNPRKCSKNLNIKLKNQKKLEMTVKPGNPY